MIWVIFVLSFYAPGENTEHLYNVKHKQAAAAFTHQPNRPDLRQVFVELISDSGV